MILRLRRQHVDLLRDEAKKVYPIEACAMLFGRLTYEEAIVKKVAVASNELKSFVRFEISPEQVIKAFNEAEKEGLSFIGPFHSHPAPAAPSLVDLKNMKLWGDVLWLILSSTNASLAAYQMKNGKVIEITIEVE